MPLSVGSRIGPYEIAAAIGAGGMGEVYLAHDTALGRDVALKTLPEPFLADADRIARFEREARVLASLNHPNVAAIHGLERSGETTVLVLEYVPGETLADKLASGPGRQASGLAATGPGLHLTEALQIARQIAEALSAAHERGIVHRDLKPANIKVTAKDQVKVLDFGLAKMVEEAAAGEAGGPGSRRGVGQPGVSQSPTLTTPAMTGMGVVLGTAAYMAPEQARGKVVDKRADIWAFGCVLYEMLTGRRPFASEEVSDTLAFVLTKEPEWSALPATTPSPIRRLLRRCLEKDRTKRLADIADARFDIDEALAAPTEVAAQVALAPPAPVWRWALPWAVTAVALGVSAFLLTRQPPATVPAAASAVRLNMDLGAPESLAGVARDIAIAPDGSRVAFVTGSTTIEPIARASRENTPPPQLYVRRFDQLLATVLPGTEGAIRPFFSPDSRWLAFFADAKLKKVSVDGGPVVVLCDAPSPRGGTWTPAGSILFQSATDIFDRSAVTQVPDSGGQTIALVSTKEAQLALRWPQLLPGGRFVLGTVPVTASQRTFNDANIVVMAVPAGTRKVVLQHGYGAQYLSTGHLIYVHDATLFAAPFDLDRLEISGPAVPVAENVRSDVGNGYAQYSVSGTGALVYFSGQAAGVDERPITWLKRDGQHSALRAAGSSWGTPRFSPDGRRIALSIVDARQNTDIWIYEWERDALVRLTNTPAMDAAPIWSPDGRWIVYGSDRTEGGTPGVSNLYAQRSDGTGTAVRLTNSSLPQFPDSWSPDGKSLVLHEGAPQSGQDLSVVSVDLNAPALNPGKPTIFLKGSFVAAMAAFSPDGRWLAYVTNESGMFNVYVRPFPGPGSQWQISDGNNPRWSLTRHELIFNSLEAPMRLLAVPYAVAGETFQAGRAAPWSDTTIANPPFSAYGIAFDLHPDGERAAVAIPAETAPVVEEAKAIVVFNFFDELRRLAPVKK